MSRTSQSEEKKQIFQNSSISLDLNIPSQRHSSSISHPHDTNNDSSKNYFNYTAMFFLSALLGTSIVLGEKNITRVFSEFILTSVMLSLIGLMIFLYYFIRSYCNAQNDLTPDQKNYIKLLILATAGFILSFCTMKIISLPALCNAKIPNNASKWIDKTFQTNVHTFTTCTILLAIVCFYIFSFAYWKWYRSHSSIPKRSFFDTDRNESSACDVFFDINLTIFLLFMIVISISAITCSVSESLIKGWINIPLSLIATTFWFGVVCTFYLHREYKSDDLSPKKRYVYYGGLTMTFFVLPIFLAITTICQAESRTLTIHSVISSVILPMFFVFIMIGVCEAILPSENREYLNSSYDNSLHQSHSNQQNYYNNESSALTPLSNTIDNSQITPRSTQETPENSVSMH